MNLLIKNKKILIFIGIIVAVIFFSNYLFAYDETIVHPTLTEEAAKLYNFNFADNKISDDEIGWIRQGSIDEDKIWGGLKQIRSGNHFYNPFGVKEWKDYNLNEKISAYFSSGIGNGSKQWAHDSVAQSEYVGGDFTWERAIYDYANGDMEHAYKSLGHILHLIEDMSVPAHTRNDFHLSPKELETYQNWLIIKNFVDYEPYETWTGKQAKAGELKFISADSLQRDNKSPIIFSNLDAYFDDMARYSNTNFFSKDTIYSYSEPNTIAFEGNEKIISGKIIDYVYEIDENGQKFKLAKIFEDLKTKQRVYDVSDNTPEIHSDYWSRLAPKSILAGAGIINLFKTEAEKAKKNPDSVQKPPTAVSYYVIDPVSKKVDEVKSSVVAFLNWGKATSIAAYDAVKTTTVTVFNKTKTGLQLTKEYVFTSADSAAAKVGDFFNLTVKSNLEFDKSNPLPAGYSLEDIISQAKAAENIKAAAVAAPIYGAELSAVKNQKTIFAPGEEIALSAKIKNIGAAIWQGEKISLNVYTGEDLAKQFYHSSWLTKVRPARLGKTEINSGAIGIFNFIVTAPIAEGDYFFRARPVWQSDKNEFNWLGDDIASWNIRVEAPPVEVAEKSADLPIDLPVENKEQIFEAEKPEEEILPEEDDLPLDEEIIIVDENIEKEKSEAEALAAAQAAFLEEETARLREEEETAARRRRARAWAAMPPDTEILEFPEDPTFETVADFKFSSTKPNSTFFCSLDSSKFEDCGEITIFEDLNSGEHILKVKAKDEYGNIDETPAEYEWTIKNPPHLVISEILFDAEDLDTGKEFIELYNPTNDPIDLNNWSLYYLKDGSSEIKPLITFDETGDYTIISKNGFFLVGFNNYSENNYLDDDYLDNNRDYIYADARRSASLLNGGVGDAVQKI
ncbi:lamin tail domain-containing protein, partial [Patescibacteria group bacterium]|nr:lamin tail domain-containing protein [Patescibacteria group bacterium]